MSILSFLRFDAKPENCNNPYECVKKAQRLIEKGRYTKAESWAKRAIELAPQNADSHMALARSLMFQDMFEEALTEIDQALSLGGGLFPGDTLFWKGRILYESQVPLSDFSEMRRRLNEAIDCLKQSQQILGRDEAVELYLDKSKKTLELL